jgi:hypothetical protein
MQMHLFGDKIAIWVYRCNYYTVVLSFIWTTYFVIFAILCSGRL